MTSILKKASVPPHMPPQRDYWDLPNASDPVVRIVQRAFFCSLIVGVSAAPSFVCAYGQYDVGGMVCGIAVFIVLYAIASLTDFADRVVHEPFVARTLWIGYGLRLFVSVVYPVGMVIDFMPGMLAVGIVEVFFGKSHGFTATLITVSLQGAFLNMLLGLFLLFVYGVQRAFLALPSKEGLCKSCGYDLRVQLEQHIPRCPECGADVLAGAAAAPPSPQGTQ